MLRDDLKNIRIDDLLYVGQISVRTANCCNNERINNLFDLLSYYEQWGLFSNIRNAGRKTCLELKSLHNRIIGILAGDTTQFENIVECIVDSKNIVSNPAYEDNETMELYQSLTSLQKDQLNAAFLFLLKDYSVRTKNSISTVSIEEFIINFLCFPDGKLLKLKNFGKRSLDEGIEFKQKLKSEILKISSFSHEHIEKERKFSKYGEFSNDEFSILFYEKYFHFPMFRILEKHLREDKSRNIKILIDTFPFFQNQKIFTREEIARDKDLTFERIRQVQNKTFQKTFEITEEPIKLKENDELIKYVQLLENRNDWIYIFEGIKELDILSQESHEIKQQLTNEKCHLSFEFTLQIIAYLFRDTFTLFGGFEFSNRNKIWKNTFLIKKEFSDIFHFEKFIEEFANYISNNQVEFDLNIEEYLSNSTCWNFTLDLDKLDNIIQIVKDILLYEFHLYSNLDGLITIPATKERSPFQIVYEILLRNGKPMHLNDIFIEFKSILPEHKYTEASQLRPYLQKHEDISHRNRSSIYTLKEWKHIKTGTIRDSIVEVLMKNDLPQTVETVTEYVLQYFPETNTASIRAAMSNDTRKRFSFFNNNLFGLSNKEYPSEYKEIEQQEGQRKTFEQRLYDMERFLSDNDHFPFSTSENEDEISLYRWWRITNNNLGKLAEHQKREIERIKNQYVDFETDKSVYEWYLNCNKVKLFILENRQWPKLTNTEKFLYHWLKKATANFEKDQLSEKQRQKFIELAKLILHVTQ